MKEKYKELIWTLKNYRFYWIDEVRVEHVDKIQETLDAAKALEELSAAYDELEQKYTQLNFKYAVLSSAVK